MADQQEKTEEASSFKLQEARKKGQVARSQELLSFAMVFAFVIAFSATAGSVATVVATHTHWWLLKLLLAILIVGLLISILQVATQVQEMTLTFVPKLIVSVVVLLVLGGWMISVLKQFALELISKAASL